ncbi:LLM class flavin-dependent oxidoreductase [Asanoa sp. NPDC049573]|uniref:LLM class flavin-dependent oxidoreductase n=1 Tax=Asanoa sp. NPDC049573 TaxID=3155396 RepID=UPI00342A25E8
MGLRFAVGLPTVGAFGDVRALTDLAVRADRHGWDGVQLWDHLLVEEPGWPVTSSTVAAAAIAASTSRIRIILTVVLPRRQVQDVAQDLAAIHALSGGRLTVLAIIGSLDQEYAAFGLDPDLRARGRALDDRLDTLTRLWADWNVGQIPIWCGGQSAGSAYVGPRASTARWRHSPAITRVTHRSPTSPRRRPSSADSPPAGRTSLSREPPTPRRQPSTSRPTRRPASLGGWRRWAGGAATSPPRRTASRKGHPPGPGDRRERTRPWRSS